MPHLSSQQVEKLAEIGTFLRDKRLELGLSLEELAAKTLVRQSILAAIENASQRSYLNLFIPKVLFAVLPMPLA
ncbi:MAG TPA: helix-turn-helix domain-containing protein [Thermosynechococcus sp. M46_R2017_013]|nr:helix-turn-helix domain-containing protein [Thermosynechococcus sp. M46_R2017_013]